LEPGARSFGSGQPKLALRDGDHYGRSPDEIVCEPGTVPKTASGKIRRAAAKNLYLGKNLVEPTRAVWWQVARLGLAGLGTRFSHFARVIREFLFAAWWWAVISVGFTLGWIAVMTLPRVSWRWAAVRALARFSLKLLGVPLSVNGIDRIPQASAVLVFNHSSYNAIVVVAALPGEPTYVAKKELAGQAFAGPLLRRLGVLFIDRFEIADSLTGPGKRLSGGATATATGVLP
jgi:hypothetical protein